MLRYSNYNAHKVLTRFTACPSNVNTCIMHSIILHSTVDPCSTSNLSKRDKKNETYTSLTSYKCLLQNTLFSEVNLSPHNLHSVRFCMCDDKTIQLR